MNSYFDENEYEVVSQTPAYPAEPYRYVPKKKKKNRVGPLLLVFALVFSLLGSAMGAGGILLWQNLTATKETIKDTPVQDLPTKPAFDSTTQLLQGQRESSVIETVNMDTGKLLTPAQVYAANVNSTVGITTSINTTNYWGYSTTAAASGSGFIISSDGYILTNFHVIEDSSSITVATYSGKTYDATVIGYDESNDIAVLKVDATGLTPVILGDSDNMNVGDNVVAIGNPLGELTFSLTAGAVSAKDREVTFSDGVTMNLLQTDCAINSGNSGGALFNLYGEVIGVTNAKYSTSSMSNASIDNIGFAIPMNSIRGIVESIIKKGYFAKPYIGITVTNVSKEAQLYGLPNGASIQSVIQGSTAAQAGLQKSDIVTQINGQAITGRSQLIDFIQKSQVGEVLTFQVYRQGEELTIEVTVGEQIQSALPEKSEQNQQSQQYPGNWGNFPGYW